MRPRLHITLSLSAILALLAPVSASSNEQPPPFLSVEPSRAAVASPYGSGSFGSWIVDSFGLPAYRYDVDQTVDPKAPRVELGGSTDAWHQLGNDHVVATAFNHGFTQLWSQDRTSQWNNLYEPGRDHYAGGFGYLNAGGQTISTFYGDRPPGAQTERLFGAGYANKTMTVPGQVEIDETTYAPFGDDPILLHDVTITNPSTATLDGSWFEYWDVNPSAPTFEVGQRARGTLSPVFDPATRTLSVEQLPMDDDVDPLTIYASALTAPVDGFDTDTTAFFGAGGRARPDAVTAGRAGGSIAPPSANGRDGRAMFAFRSPLRIGPRQSETLRYAYGAAHARAITPLLTKYAGGNPIVESQAQWRAWLPQASFDAPQSAWVARELQWDAYMLRSGTSYDETCGHHIISQGGYYQYGMGLQGAFRDQLQIGLAMINTDPEIARETIRYSAQQQEAVTGQAPYATGHMCTPVPLPFADMDFSLILAAAEYALATRDFDFFDEVIRYQDGTEASLWDHLKLAYRHAETFVGRGPHGGYNVATNMGDSADFANVFTQMTESMYLTAQLAYAYPRLAQVAEARGDTAFAGSLRSTGEILRRILDKEWTARGWISRGYKGQQQIGVGVMYADPQVWGLLAHAVSPERAPTLLDNYERYLSGRNAPAVVGGPSLIGSAAAPAANDPGVHEERISPLLENGGPLGAYGGGNAGFGGGIWYSVNGPLIWALTETDGLVPSWREPVDFAWDEYLRNSLANHATVYPDRWNGIISVDDFCNAWYSPDPTRCGDEALTAQYGYAGEIMNKHSWMLWAMTKLAGLKPVADGYDIAPHFPFERFSLRLPGAGVAAEPGMLRGYVRPERADTLVMRVRLPSAADPTTARAWAGGESVPFAITGNTVTFTLPASVARAPADWAVTWSVQS